MLNEIGRSSIGFDDFRANGILLPATEKGATNTGLPMHRGPHKRYNEVVIARIGCIEREWSAACKLDRAAANEVAITRLEWLQSALRKRLINQNDPSYRRSRLVLNRKDPIGTGFDFSELDDMAAMLYGATDVTA